MAIHYANKHLLRKGREHQGTLGRSRVVFLAGCKLNGVPDPIIVNVLKIAIKLNHLRMQKSTIVPSP